MALGNRTLTLRQFRQDNAAKHPDDGVRISFNLHDPSSMKAIGEVRGSFGLQTGGYSEVVVVENVLKRSNGLIDDDALKESGATVRLTHFTQKAAAPGKQTALTPGEPLDGEDVLEFKLATSNCPVTRLDVTTPSGKRYAPIALEFERGITHAKFTAAPFPDDTQLSVTIHRQARQVRVPFVLKEIEIPERPQKTLGKLGPNDDKRP